jgi:threonine dehydrogenase-like Zn-dependent dehydrogenase
LPATLDASDAALVEPLAVAVRGVRLAGVGLGSTVAVIGGGTVGLLAAVAARAAGASTVRLSARHAFQQDAAAALGAEALEGDGYDVVLETVGGGADTLRQSVGLVRAGGTVGVLGVFGADVAFPAFDFSMREVRLVGSNCYGRGESRSDFSVALALLGAEREAIKALVTHRFSLDDANEAFAVASDKSTGAIKVHIEP